MFALRSNSIHGLLFERIAKSQTERRNESVCSRHVLDGATDLRVGEITADTHVPQGQTLREQRLDETEIAEAKTVTVTELDRAEPAECDGLSASLKGLGDAVLDHEVYDSIYTRAKWRCSYLGAARPRPRNGHLPLPARPGSANASCA